VLKTYYSHWTRRPRTRPRRTWAGRRPRAAAARGCGAAERFSSSARTFATYLNSEGEASLYFIDYWVGQNVKLM